MRFIFILPIRKSYYSKVKIFAILFVCLNVLGPGCLQKETDTLTTIRFVSEDIIDNENFEVAVLELESTKESMIHGISQLLTYGNYIFVLDNMQSRRINIYDTTGKYIDQLGINGKGPGEYLHPWSISINRVKKEIAVLDAGQSKVFYYDLINFSFIKSSEIPIDATKMEFLDNDLIAWYGSQPQSHILVTDTLYNTVQELIPKEFNPVHKKGYGTSNLFTSGSEVLFYTPFSPNLYTINSDSAVLKYAVEFKGHRFTPIKELKRFDENKDDYIKYISESSYIQFCDFYDTHRIMYCNFYADGEMFMGFLKKSNNRAIYHTKDNLIKSLKLPKFFNPVGQYNDYLVCTINNMSVLDSYETGAVFNPQIDAELIKISEDSGFFMLLIKYNG
jgi:hypothetical protein